MALDTNQQMTTGLVGAREIGEKKRVAHAKIRFLFK